jgi:hypothetical protein
VLLVRRWSKPMRARSAARLNDNRRIFARPRGPYAGLLGRVGVVQELGMWTAIRAAIIMRGCGAPMANRMVGYCGWPASLDPYSSALIATYTAASTQSAFELIA